MHLLPGARPQTLHLGLEVAVTLLFLDGPLTPRPTPRCWWYPLPLRVPLFLETWSLPIRCIAYSEDCMRAAGKPKALTLLPISKCSGNGRGKVRDKNPSGTGCAEGKVKVRQPERLERVRLISRRRSMPMLMNLQPQHIVRSMLVVYRFLDSTPDGTLLRRAVTYLGPYTYNPNHCDQLRLDIQQVSVHW